MSQHSQYGAALAAVTRERGVTGAVLAGERDGMVIDAVLEAGVDGAALAAFAASLYRRARLSAAAAGLGGTGWLRLEAEGGQLCVAGQGRVVLIALTEPAANAGSVRGALLRELRGIA